MKARGIISGVILLILLMAVVSLGLKLYQDEEEKSRLKHFGADLTGSISASNPIDTQHLLSQLHGNRAEIKVQKQDALVKVCSDVALNTNPVLHKMQITTVRKLLDLGADPNQPDESGIYALNGAIRSSFTISNAVPKLPKPEIVEYLLQNHADPTLQTSAVKPMNEARDSSNISAMKLLLKYGAQIGIGKASDGQPYLVFAAEKGDLELVKMLLTQGAKVNQEGAQHETALQSAVASDRLEVVELLVRNSANINHKDLAKKSILQLAKLTNDKILTQFLVEHGAK